MLPWAYTSPQPKRHLNRFSRFCTAHCTVSLYFTTGRPFPLKIAPSHGESGPPSNTWFLGPTRVLNPNGIAIGSAVFVGLTAVTDRRQTDHATQSVTIHLCVVLQCGLIIQCMTSGQRRTGRPRTRWKDNITKWTGLLMQSLEDRTRCWMIVHEAENPWIEDG